ncbi:MAG: winged helix-turn-helix domain-containing protein [Gemmatimonadaceae bacterium]
MTRTGRNAVADILRDRILNGLHVGQLHQGDRLPSARKLSSELNVNPRVVLAALRALANEGFIELRPRSGAFVGTLHPATGSRLPDLGVWIVNTLLQARTRGLAPRDVPALMRRSLRRRPVHAACIECNADQLHMLCSELAEDHGFQTKSVEVARLSKRESLPVLRKADVLVTTLYHSAEVQAVAERLGKPWITVTLRPEVMLDVGSALRAGPVFYIATDPRFEPKLRHMLEPLADVKRLRVLLLDRDDLSVIPDEAATYVMTSARAEVRRRYGAREFPGRPIHPPRILSEESARELLFFLVRANVVDTAAPKRTQRQPVP